MLYFLGISWKCNSISIYRVFTEFERPKTPAPGRVAGEVAVAGVTSFA